jgi:hypothetical protein
MTTCMKGLSLLTVALSLVWSSPVLAQLPKITGENLATGKLLEFHTTPNAQGTVVVFVSSKCPCSQTHVQHLKALAGEFQGFDFVGVVANQDEDLKVAREYFAGLGLPFPVIRDSAAAIANALGAVKTPHAFVLNSKGEVVFDGGVSNSSNGLTAGKYHLQLALGQMRSGAKPEPSRVRTLGCEIKR